MVDWGGVTGFPVQTNFLSRSYELFLYIPFLKVSVLKIFIGLVQGI